MKKKYTISKTKHGGFIVTDKDTDLKRKLKSRHLKNPHTVVDLSKSIRHMKQKHHNAIRRFFDSP